ncbi:hypothetical protein JCM24511_03742 [Saitozyma sp. JCM 24511]|nr:hypothetical protein JCM24511_03742 [Saitozyma sp. JCM 24511]
MDPTHIKEPSEKEAALVEEQTVEDHHSMPDSLRSLTDEERRNIEKKVVRKADLVIMPIIGLLYILNYVDRQNLSAAKLQGIMTDLHMSTTDFATAVAILFVGYLPFQIPSNLMITKVPRPGLYICVATVIWGTISACTAAVQSYGTLLLVRIILGFSEAVFFPGVIYLLSAWYTKNELGARIGGLYIGQQLGNAFGGLIAAGVLKLDGAHGIAGWRWLFIVEGVATVGIGAISAFVMPEWPYNAKMLKPIEREMAVWRLAREAGAAEGTEQIGTWKGFLVGLKDPKVYALIFCNMMGQVQGSIANFFPTIVKVLGYNSTVTLLLTAPPYIFAAFVYMAITWGSDRTKHIYWFIILPVSLSIVMYAIPMGTTNTGALYFAMMFMPWTSVAAQLLLYKTVNHHLPRPIAKRAATVAMLNSIGGISNVWTSYLWYAPPHYYAAFGALIAASVLFLITITGYKYYVRYQNKLLSGTPEQVKKAMRFGITQEQVDMGWRYEGF